MYAVLSTLHFIGTWGFSGAVAAFVYWLLQKYFENKFAKRLEDYRHTLATAAQNEQIRLELYNRRFEIFSSIFDFYEALISWSGTPEQKAARNRFFRAYQESGFLFQKESGIEALLKHLYDEAAKVTGFKEHPDLYKSEPQLFIEKFEEITHIQLGVFEEGLARLKSALSEYLNFHNLDPVARKPDRNL